MGQQTIIYAPMKTIVYAKKYYTLLCFAVTLGLGITSCGGSGETTQPAADTCQVAFSADSAYAHIVSQCDFGARVPGSEAHRKCGDWIVEQFRALGLQVEEQSAPITMWDGKTFTCRNIIAAAAPQGQQATNGSNQATGSAGQSTASTLPPLVICAHWDSRPWADSDPDESKRQLPVMAANDGASGVAVMLEVARLLPQLQLQRPVHFVCFDLEDYGNSAHENSFALGAEYWSKHCTTPYEGGILLDMVGGQGARFCYEGFSLHYAQSLLSRVWGAAQTAGASAYFPYETGGAIDDDHKPMNEIAGIPTIDIIPYYNIEGVPTFGPTWHTTHDTPENISRQTLSAVGQTLLQFLYEYDHN